MLLHAICDPLWFFGSVQDQPLLCGHSEPHVFIPPLPRECMHRPSQALGICAMGSTRSGSMYLCIWKLVLIFSSYNSHDRTHRMRYVGHDAPPREECRPNRTSFYMVSCIFFHEAFHPLNACICPRRSLVWAISDQVNPDLCIYVWEALTDMLANSASWNS